MALVLGYQLWRYKISIRSKTKPFAAPTQS
jgi:hypothetical protein